MVVVGVNLFGKEEEGKEEEKWVMVVVVVSLFEVVEEE